MFVPAISPDTSRIEVVRAVVLQAPHERLAGYTRRLIDDPADNAARLLALTTLAEIDDLDREMRS
ncbi:hypothetical protein L0F51_04110 [Afifella sp. H1R]|uniref:hypothetical protein n=1 Tax=Afifella sp. H1R TaxID=2908841 RepID=UPI001F3568DF|nr:hypothetical protein [Afifella sp. H1R]MCF1502949.1 hypothetical protein [Afifella sp. H1R]